MAGRAGAFLLLLVQAQAAIAAERWLEVRSPNFTVVSNSSEGSARHCAWQFEQMRVALSKLWPWARFGSTKSVLVAAVKDEASLKRLAPEYWETKGGLRPVSVTVDGRDRRYMLLRTDEKVRDEITVNPYFNAFRAYVHVVLDASLEQPLPLWLNVALAEFYGNLAVRDKDLLLGRVISWHRERLVRGERLRLAELLAVDGHSPLYTQHDRRELLSAEAWGFFHFLNYADKGAYVPRLRSYVALSLQGKAAGAREALGDLAALEAEYRRHFDANTIAYSVSELQVGLERERFPVRTLSAGQLAAIQAAIHVAMERPLEAAAQLEVAKQAEPERATTWDAEGLVQDLKQDKEKASAAYAHAAALGSTSAHTHYRIAQLAWKQGAGDDVWRAIAQSLERAVALDPDLANAHSYLAEVKVRLKQAVEAEPLARKAVSLEPGVSYHRVALARVLSDLGRRDEALAAAQHGLRLARRDRDRSNAQELIDYLRGREAR